MIDRKQWGDLYAKLKIIETLNNRGGASKSRTLRASGISYTIGYIILEDMEKEEFVTINQVARNSWVQVDKKGRVLYLKYRELMEMTNVEP